MGQTREFYIKKIDPAITVNGLNISLKKTSKRCITHHPRFIIIPDKAVVYIDKTPLVITKFTLVKINKNTRFKVVSQHFKSYYSFSFPMQSFKPRYVLYPKIKPIDKPEWIIGLHNGHKDVGFGCGNLIRPRKEECMHFHKDTIEILICTQGQFLVRVNSNLIKIKQKWAGVFFPGCRHSLFFDKNLFPYMVNVFQFPFKQRSLSFDKIPTNE